MRHPHTPRLGPLGLALGLAGLALPAPARAEDLQAGTERRGGAARRFELTPHLRFGGQDNVIAVRLAQRDRSSRWYPGAIKRRGEP